MTDTYRRLTATEAAAHLRGDTDTLILLHRHPDGDAIGSAFALRILLEGMGCRALCACIDEIPDRLRFLVGSMQDSILQANLPADFTPAQIIAVDTASPAQMGDLLEIYGNRVDLMIDHHGRGEMYADGWISPESAATGEMILSLGEILVAEGRISAIPVEAARLLYVAISSDTGCFRYSNVTPATLRAAATLLETGFDAAELNYRLFEVKSEKLMCAERLGLERLSRHLDGRLAVIGIPYSVKTENGLSDEHMETLVDIARSVEGAEVAVAIRQNVNEPIFRVSMRASGNVDVSEICATFGGGGHKKAAGCTVTCAEGEDIAAAVARVVDAVRAALG